MKQLRFSLFQCVQIITALLIICYVSWSAYSVLYVDQSYDGATWTRFAISGITLGSVYAIVAIGYTLVYGVLLMINFAHGEIMMLGSFAGYLSLEVLAAPLSNYPALAVAIAFIVGASTSMLAGMALERIAYRPLRGAPRLVPLISAIGASIFLQNAAQLIFSPRRRIYSNPEFLERNQGISFLVGGESVVFTYTGILTIILSLTILLLVYLVVQRTQMGCAMRAVAQDRRAAALMGIDVDKVIGQTFALSGAMAGAAGVMWGLHNGIIHHFMGFIPGLKAFTAAVLGGIGNIPGAAVGGLTLGLVEALGPPLLDLPFQLKDVVAFSILVLILIFRPSGLLGEAVSEDKV